MENGNLNEGYLLFVHSLLLLMQRIFFCFDNVHKEILVHIRLVYCILEEVHYDMREGLHLVVGLAVV